jgi:endonuclease/exonuclease/phosphatase family metal-dependent hydrolase
MNLKQLLSILLLTSVLTFPCYAIEDEPKPFSSPTTQALMPLKLATWNIAWLGSHEYNQRTSNDYKALARYAKQLNADVIALQEVENEYWAKKVLGDDYHYYFTSRDWVQRVGVAIKKSAQLSVQAKEYKALDVGKVRNGLEITLSRNGKEISLLAVHLKSGCFAKPLDKQSIEKMPSDTDKAQKAQFACEVLSKQIPPLEQWIDNKANNNQSVIVLGDFNRRFTQDIIAKHAENQGLWQAINDVGQQSLWAPTNSLNSQCWGGYYKDYIDHIVFNPAAKALYREDSFKQLIFDEKYTQALSRSLTDHCPISVTLNF